MLETNLQLRSRARNLQISIVFFSLSVQGTKAYSEGLSSLVLLRVMMLTLDYWQMTKELGDLAGNVDVQLEKVRSDDRNISMTCTPQTILDPTRSETREGRGS